MRGNRLLLDLLGDLELAVLALLLEGDLVESSPLERGLRLARQGVGEVEVLLPRREGREAAPPPPASPLSRSPDARGTTRPNRAVGEPGAEGALGQIGDTARTAAARRPAARRRRGQADPGLVRAKPAHVGELEPAEPHAGTAPRARPGSGPSRS